jgi:hypothetical protein
LSYCAPLLFDQNGKTLGFFGLHTDRGSIVVIAESSPRFDEFVHLARELANADGKGLGVMEFNVTSLAAVLSAIQSTGVPLRPNTQYIDDSDPLFDPLLNSLRRLTASRREYER